MFHLRNQLSLSNCYYPWLFVLENIVSLSFPFHTQNYLLIAKTIQVLIRFIFQDQTLKRQRVKLENNQSRLFQTNTYNFKSHFNHKNNWTPSLFSNWLSLLENELNERN